MPDELLGDLRRFIDQEIESVAQLEVLLLLREHAERDWSVAEVATALYIAPEMCATILTGWVRRKLVVVTTNEPRYRYCPPSPEAEELLGRLATAYRERRVTVITAIYAKPIDRVRTFADAFRLRRDDA